ncbi:MAG: S41 family peptidase [Caldicoprobacter oshimai]|nr:MAG: hypothetical protein DIU64_03115 [Caldicoprobacter oshimai]
MKNKSILQIFVLYISAFLVYLPVRAEVVQGSELLDEAIYILKRYYAGEVSEDVLMADDIEDAIKALGDPYSAYMSPQEYRAFIESIEMELVGIGVSVEKASDGLVITSVFRGSGAEEAGLRPGDVIVQADGVDLRDMDLSQAIMYIRGEENTSVSLTVKRGESTFSVKVLRKRISLPTVEWDLIDGVGYIRVLSFGDDTPAQFKRALEEVKAAGARGLIVDLRGNGGGYLQSAVDMIGYFVGAKPATLVHVKSEGRYYIFSESDHLVDMPVLVLVDGYTASASELFAGALQDYGRAGLIGSNTYGKGSIQWIFPLSDGSMLKLTVGYFYTPSGKQINGVGLKPDLALQDDFL